MAQFLKFFIRQNGALQFDLMTALEAGMQKILFGTNRRFGGSDNFFAYAIDRRIRHLSEKLFKIIVKQLRLV